MKPFTLQYKKYMMKKNALLQNYVDLQPFHVHHTINGYIVKKAKMNNSIKAYYHLSKMLMKKNVVS